MLSTNKISNYAPPKSKVSAYYDEVQQKLSDSRDIRGKRHELAFVVVLFLTAILRSDKSLQLAVIHRGMEEDFYRLSTLLDIKAERCISYSQLKRVLRSIDYELFNEINAKYFNATVATNAEQWYSIDGKELRGTIDGVSGKKRGLSIVNLTAHQSRQSTIVGHYDATKSSEKPIVNQYFSQADLTNKHITFDALHTSKKNLDLIQQKEGVYLAQVKANQKKLLEAIKALHQSSKAIYEQDGIEQGHGRIETRQYLGYNLDISLLNSRWKATGCCTVIVVNKGRFNLKRKKESSDTSYWISNQMLDNQTFTNTQKAIRGHWSVEVHHHIRDVQMGEDAMKISNKKEAIGVANFLTLATNLLENKGGNKSILREKLTKNWEMIHNIF